MARGAFCDCFDQQKKEERSGRFLLVGDLKSVHKIQIAFVKIELVLKTDQKSVYR